MIVYCFGLSHLNNIMLEPISYTSNTEKNKLEADNLERVENSAFPPSSLTKITNTNTSLDAVSFHENKLVQFVKEIIKKEEEKEKIKIIDSLNNVHNVRVDEINFFAKQSTDSFIQFIRSKYPILKSNHLEILENTHKLEFDIIKKEAIKKLNDNASWYIHIINSKKFADFKAKDKINLKREAEKILRETKVENIRIMANKSLDLYNTLRLYHSKSQTIK